MVRLGHVRQEVPECVRVLQVGLRVALLGVDEVGELRGVADEEHRGVVSGHVPVALLGLELHCESARVALSISRALFAAHS